MGLEAELYVAGTQYMLKGLGRPGRRARKEFSVREAHSPLGMSFRTRANDAATSGVSEREDRDEPRDDDWSVKHGVYLDWRKPREEVAALTQTFKKVT